jgi:uncharacterized protein (TIGR03067 family)
MSMWLWWLGQNTVTIAVMIPFVLLLSRLFRNRPAAQHLLWLVVLVKFLTPPILSWPWTVEQLGGAIWSTPAVESASAPQPSPQPAPGEIANDVAGDGPTRPVDLSDADLQRRIAAERTASIDTPSSTPGQQPSTVSGVLARVIAGGWLLGALASGIFQLRRIIRHASVIRRGTAAPERLTSEIRATANRLDIRPPDAILARGILSPFMWCAGRLRLVWPATLASDNLIARFRGVIAHELAHVRRGDHRVAWLELVAGIVWWWNPLFWFVRRRLRETAEMACDALAIGTNPESRREYAEQLLELSAGFTIGAPAPVLAVSAGTPSSFERRLSMILSDRVDGKLSCWGILAAVCFALPLLPGWSLGQQKEPPEVSQQVSDPLPVPPRGIVDAEQVDLPDGVEGLEEILERVNDLLAAGKLEEAAAWAKYLKAVRPPRQEPPRLPVALEEASALQGDWKLVAGEVNGEKMDLEGGGQLTITGKFFIQRMRRPSPTTAWTEEYGYRYTIDPGREPKQLDLKDESGQRSRGIYSVKGDTLEVCFGEPGAERPTRFSTKKREKGAGSTLSIYKRLVTKPDRGTALPDRSESNDARILGVWITFDEAGQVLRVTNQTPRELSREELLAILRGAKRVEFRPATGFAPKKIPGTRTEKVPETSLLRVRARFAGEVERQGTTNGRALRVGDRVKKGQLLAVVKCNDPDKELSRLLDAVSNLEFDTKKLKNLKVLFEHGVAPERAVRDAQRAVDADVVAVKQAMAVLETKWKLTRQEIEATIKETELVENTTEQPGGRWARVQVRAPADGTIVEKNVSIGDIVTPDVDLYKIGPGVTPPPLR